MSGIFSSLIRYSSLARTSVRAVFVLAGPSGSGRDRLLIVRSKEAHTSLACSPHHMQAQGVRGSGLRRVPATMAITSRAAARTPPVSSRFSAHSHQRLSRVDLGQSNRRSSHSRLRRLIVTSTGLSANIGEDGVILRKRAEHVTPDSVQKSAIRARSYDRRQRAL